MIPKWKLQREVRRIGLQIRAGYDILTGPGRRRRYDAQRPGNLRITMGKMPPQPHMVIFLLYQPKGLAASVRLAIDTVLQHPVSMVFVSNLPLQDADRDWLAARSWKVIERPNVGYDFGGFREGVMQIVQANLTPARLWILNDSTWFPVCGGPGALEHVIDPAADVSGSMVHHDGRDHAKDNIESYFLSFTQTALTHPAFVTFWASYAMYQDKLTVIRRGEQRLSRVLREAGLTVNSAMTNDSFLARLRDQPADFVHKTLLYAGLTKVSLRADRLNLLDTAEDSTQWRDRAVAHVAQTLIYSEFRYQYCYAAVHLMGFPFVKKGPDPRSVIGRARYLDAVRAGDMPPLPAPILQELTAAVARDLTLDHRWRPDGV